LTRRANQRHIDIIAKIIRPAPANRQRAFSFPRREFEKSVSICLIFFVAVSLKFEVDPDGQAAALGAGRGVARRDDHSGHAVCCDLQ
jgi:hypothetical protein